LPVEGLCGRCDGEAGCEGSSAEFGCTTTGGKDRADGNIFDEIGVYSRALDECFEGTMEEISGCRVFEATPAAFRDGCSERASYDDIVGVLF
jgi:hypothetical protein